MSTAQRAVDTGVIRRLLREPHRFRFFQAIRLLERFFASRDGRAAGVLARRLRFRNTLDMAFAPSEICALRARRRDGTAVDLRDAGSAPDLNSIEEVVVTPAFMGLLGASGALPFGYTERLADREIRRRDRAARAFLDIFTNRALALFYAAWKKYRPAFQYELEGETCFLPLIAALAGVEAASARARIASGPGGVPARAIAFYGGIIGQRPMSAAALARLLGEYFQADIQIHQFAGAWYRIPADCRSPLGAARTRLGCGAVLGRRVWQCDLRLRIFVGPLTRARYRDFLPGGAAASALERWLTLLGGDALEYQVCPVLRAEDVHALRLGVDGARLGWDSFMCTRASVVERSDARYLLRSAARASPVG